MAKKGKKEKKEERLTRRQRKAAERSFSAKLDPEDLNAQLRSLGLCTKNIAGDGNCLFRSLSDQYYGHDGMHKQIRQEICQYLKKNEETYKFFIEDDQEFDHHIECMSQNGTFGGNMELAAFAKLKEIDIKVYQPGLIYVIQGKDDEKDGQADEEILEGATEGDSTERQILHIAYHSWEHYDSVRNLDGPHTGPPEIKTSPENQYNQTDQVSAVKEDTEGEDANLNSKEKVVLNACPNVSIHKIRRLLLKYKQDPNKVIDAIYEFDNSKGEDDSGITTETTTLAAAETDEKESLEGAAIDSHPRSIQNEDGALQGDQKDSTSENTVQPSTATEALKDLTGNNEKSQTHNEDPQERKVVDKADNEQVISKDKVDNVVTTAKKPSAAERKKEKKKKQKEQKLMKERAKAARKAKYKDEEEGRAAAAALVDSSASSSSAGAMKVVSI